jgi:hypothetical protein
MSFHHAALLLALVVPGVFAASGSAPLQLSGHGPYYRVTLPAAIYPLAQDAELSDLRVHNAQGAPLPWAWALDMTEPPVVRRHSVPLFPLATPGQAADAAVLLQVRPDGTLAWRKPTRAKPQPQANDWVIDTHAAGGNLLSLDLKLDARAQGLFSLSLETSDDLQQWQMALPHASVAQWKHQGQALQQTEVELGGLRARYLRLRWLGDGPAPALKSAEIQAYERVLPSPPPLQWQMATPTGCEQTFCTWALPDHLPIDAVRLTWAESNTVATISLLGEVDMSLAPVAKPRRHRLFTRDRHQGSAQVAPGSGVQRHTLLHTTLYRLSLPGQPERSNSEQMLDGHSYHRLRLEARQSIQEWGARPPVLSVATRSREIILLARDAANAQLSWGDPKAAGQSMALDQIMPLGLAQATGSGRVMLPINHQGQTPRPGQPGNLNSGVHDTPQRAVPDKVGENTVWLWAALAGGLLLLVAMAYSLLKGLKPRS